MNEKTINYASVRLWALPPEGHADVINSLVEACCAASARKGWHDAIACNISSGPRDPIMFYPDTALACAPEKIALCHSELSEALECLRNKEPFYHKGDGGKPEGVASELADTVIRIFDLAGILGLDLGTAIAEKMAYNETRPIRHGGKAF